MEIEILVNKYIEYYKKTYPEKQIKNMFDGIDLNDDKSTNHIMEMFYTDILKYNKIDLQQIIDFKNTHSNVKIIHRVNDCDKPRGDSDKLDKILIETFKIVDKITKNFLYFNGYGTVDFNSIYFARPD